MMFTLGDVSDILDTALDTGLDIVDVLNKLSDCADEGRLSRERCFDHLNLSDEIIAEENCESLTESIDKHVTQKRVLSDSNNCIQDNCSTKEFVYNSNCEQSQHHRSSNSTSQIHYYDSTLNEESVVHHENNNKSCRDAQILLLKEKQRFIGEFPEHVETLSRRSPSHELLSGTCTTVHDEIVNKPNSYAASNSSSWISDKFSDKVRNMSLLRGEELCSSPVHSYDRHKCSSQSNADVFSFKDIHDSDILDALGELCRVADEIMKNDERGLEDTSSGLRLESINEQVDGCNYYNSHNDICTKENEFERIAQSHNFENTTVKEIKTDSTYQQVQRDTTPYDKYLKMPQMHKKVLSLPSVVDTDSNMSELTITDDNVVEENSRNINKQRPETYVLTKWNNVMPLTAVDINISNEIDSDEEVKEFNTNDEQNTIPEEKQNRLTQPTNVCLSERYDDKAIEIPSTESDSFQPSKKVRPACKQESHTTNELDSLQSITYKKQREYRPGTYNLQTQILDEASSLQINCPVNYADQRENQHGTCKLETQILNEPPQQNYDSVNCKKQRDCRPGTYLLNNSIEHVIGNVTDASQSSREINHSDTSVILSNKPSKQVPDKKKSRSKFQRPVLSDSLNGSCANKPRPGTFVIDDDLVPSASKLSSSKDQLDGRRRSRPDTFVINSDLNNSTGTAAGPQERKHQLSSSKDQLDGRRRSRPDTFVINSDLNNSTGTAAGPQERKHQLSSSKDQLDGRRRSRPDTFVINSDLNNSTGTVPDSPEGKLQLSSKKDQFDGRRRSRPDTFVINSDLNNSIGIRPDTFVINSDLNNSAGTAAVPQERKHQLSSSKDQFDGRRRSRPDTFVINSDLNNSTGAAAVSSERKHQLSSSKDQLIGRRRSRPDTFVINSDLNNSTGAAAVSSERKHQLSSSKDQLDGRRRSRPDTFVINSDLNNSTGTVADSPERKHQLSSSKDQLIGRRRSRPDTFVINSDLNNSTGTVPDSPERKHQLSSSKDQLTRRRRSRPDTFVINSDLNNSTGTVPDSPERQHQLSSSKDQLTGRRRSRPDTFVINSDLNNSTAAASQEDQLIKHRGNRPDTFVISPRKDSVDKSSRKQYDSTHIIKSNEEAGLDDFSLSISPRSPRIKQTTSEPSIPCSSDYLSSKSESTAELERIEESLPLKTHRRATSFDQWPISKDRIRFRTGSLTSNPLSENTHSSASISSESWSNSYKIPYSPSFDDDYITSSTFSDDIGVSQIFGCSRTQSELSLQPMKHERTQSYEDISPSKVSLNSSNISLSASMPNVHFVQPTNLIDIDNTPQPITKDAITKSYIVTKPTYNPDVMEDVAEKLGSLYDYMSISLNRLHEIQRCQTTAVHIYSDDIDNISIPSTKSQLNDIIDMDMIKQSYSNKSNYNVPGFPNRENAFNESPFQLKRAGTYVVDCNKTSTPPNTVTVKQNSLAKNLENNIKKPFNISKVKTTRTPPTTTTTAVKNEKNRQPLTARLKMLKMKLEERRKHIETEKKKMESEWNDEMAKVGQSAFWFAIGNETNESNNDTKDEVDHPSINKDQQVSHTGKEHLSTKTPIRSANDKADDSKSPAWHISLDSPSNADTEDSEHQHSKPSKPKGLMFVPLCVSDAEVDQNKSKTQSPPMECSTPVCLSESYGHLLKKSNPIIETEQNQSTVDDIANNMIGSSTPLINTEDIFNPETLIKDENNIEKDINTDDTFAASLDDDATQSDNQQSISMDVNQDSTTSNDQPRHDRKLWSNQNEPIIPKVSSSFIPPTDGSALDIQSVEDQNIVTQKIKTTSIQQSSITELTTLHHDLPETFDYTSDKYPSSSNVGKTLVVEESNQKEDSLANADNLHREDIVSKDLSGVNPPGDHKLDLEASNHESHKTDQPSYNPNTVDTSNQSEMLNMTVDRTNVPLHSIAKEVTPQAFTQTQDLDKKKKTSNVVDFSTLKYNSTSKESQLSNVQKNVCEPAEHSKAQQSRNEDTATVIAPIEQIKSNPSSMAVEKSNPSNIVDFSVLQYNSSGNSKFKKSSHDLTENSHKVIKNIETESVDSVSQIPLQQKEHSKPLDNLKSLQYDSSESSENSNSSTQHHQPNQLPLNVLNDQFANLKTTDNFEMSKHVEHASSSLEFETQHQITSNNVDRPTEPESLPKPIIFQNSLTEDSPTASHASPETHPSTAVHHHIRQPESNTNSMSNGMPHDVSPNSKGTVLIIGDGDNSELGITPEQMKKRERFLKNRQKRQEEERAKREAASAKKAKKELKHKSQSLNFNKTKAASSSNENIALTKQHSEESVAKTELLTFHPVTQRPFAEPITQQPSDVGNQSLAQRLAADLSSNQPSSQSQFSEYKGPSAYVKPTGKSNRKIMNNAISHCCLSGEVNRNAKDKCLQELGKSDGVHFLVLFRDGLKFRSLYAYTPDPEQVTKLYGIGPKQITKKMIDKLYKYNSGGKEFTFISAKSLSIQVDGLTIKKEYWQSAKSSAKPESNLKRQPFAHIK